MAGVEEIRAGIALANEKSLAGIAAITQASLQLDEARTALLAATAAVQEALAALRRSGMPDDDGALSFSGFTDLIGLPEIQRLEARYAAAPGPAAPR